MIQLLMKRSVWWWINSTSPIIDCITHMILAYLNSGGVIWWECDANKKEIVKIKTFLKSGAFVDLEILFYQQKPPTRLFVNVVTLLLKIKPPLAFNMIELSDKFSNEGFDDGMTTTDCITSRSVTQHSSGVSKWRNCDAKKRYIVKTRKLRCDAVSIWN